MREAGILPKRLMTHKIDFPVRKAVRMVSANSSLSTKLYDRSGKERRDETKG